VNAEGAYANLILPALLRERGLTGRDAAFATELLAGTCRWQGSYDVIIAAAAGRPLSEFQPAVVDLLRLGVHQILSMRVPVPAAVAASVDLAAATVGERATSPKGVTNMIGWRYGQHIRAGSSMRMPNCYRSRNSSRHSPRTIPVQTSAWPSGPASPNRQISWVLERS
jgi:16S rRNA (cytosine967-C5)-methyltransferase